MSEDRPKFKKEDTLWEGTIGELIEGLKLFLERRGMPTEEATRQAIAVVLFLAQQFGGIVTYIPRADVLRLRVRDSLLISDLNASDRSTNARMEIARKYGVSHPQVYRIERNWRSNMRRNPNWEKFVALIAEAMGVRGDAAAALSTKRRVLV
jgi:Mor family transcriptional regulator